MKRTFALVCAATALAFLTACTSSPEEAIESTELPSESVAPSQAPSGGGTQRPDESSALTCDKIVTQQTVAGFEIAGWELADDYEATVRTDGSVDAWFFDLGGVACWWGVEGNIDWFSAGYSPLSSADASAIQSELEAAGYVRDDNPDFVIYREKDVTESIGQNKTYMFDVDAWYHSNYPDGAYEVRDAVSLLE